MARQRFTVLILAGWGLIAGFALALIRLLESRLPATTPSPQLLVAPARAFLAPEAVERTVFLAGLALVPPLLLLLVIWAGAGTSGRPYRWTPGPLDALMDSTIALLLLWPLPRAFAIRAIGGIAGFSTDGSWIRHLVLAFITALGLVVVTILRRRPWCQRRRPLLNLAVLAAMLAAVGGLLAFRVFGFSHLSGSAVWSDHLDAVAAAIAQVLAGGTLLVDAPSQYGLYPELLGPLLHLLPRGVLGLTLAFAAIQVICLLSLMGVLRHRIQQPIVLAIALLALVMVTFAMPGLLGFRFAEPDPYFQYWPVRFAGPALSIPLCFWMVGRLSWSRLGLMAGFTGLCLFANLDSGVAVLYANSMLLLLMSGIAMVRQHCGRWRWPSLALAAGLLPVVSLLSFALLLLLLHLKAGEPLQLSWLTGYQSTFYALGFMMMPLAPWPDAWQVVVGVYAMALLLALSELRAGRPLAHQLPLLYLPLLGAGLFIYFQGRSHFFNLVSVSWPAILITALLADRHLLALRWRLVPRSTFVLPVVGLTALLIPALALIFDYSQVVRRWRQAPLSRPDPSAPAAPQLRTELEMVGRFCGPGQPPCLLLSKRQGIYALQAGTASRWRGPAPAELLLEADRRKLLEAIAAGQPERILLGVDNSAVPSLGLTPAQLQSRYRAAAANREGTMVLFVRRNGSASRER